jgi:hypothetical protein
MDSANLFQPPTQDTAVSKRNNSMYNYLTPWEDSSGNTVFDESQHEQAIRELAFKSFSGNVVNGLD